MSRVRLRCAVYTRKSSEEGLEQEFNSLEAQREACAAYITSQKHEGWSIVACRYDDGGLSGGNMDRPALRRLLSDIGEGRVDVVVVYKVDRLTRSLSDFARIVEAFDAQGVSFVSVTQQFNTTTSMGRLTLNVLLSFAQFEREVTAERIRDKIAASKKKGMWMGGNVPLGYDVIDRRLVISEAEAATVRQLFALYLQHGSVQRVCAEALRLGLRTKARARRYNDRRGGEPFQRGHLYKLLSNPIYISQIAHKGERYPGVHQAIIDRAIWDQAQELLAGHAVTRRRPAGAGTSLLAGLLFDNTGRRLTPTHATKKGRRYRYYASHSEAGPSGWRLPAQILENAVCNLIADNLKDRRRLLDGLIPASVPVAKLADIFDRSAGIGQRLRDAGPSDQRELLMDLVQRIGVAEGRIQIDIRVDRLRAKLDIESPERCQNQIQTSLPEVMVIEHPFCLRKRGVETKVIIADKPTPAVLDHTLVSLISQGHRWFAEIRDGRSESVRDLSRRHHVDRGDISRTLPLAFLAPDIVEAILAGRQPVELTATKLRRGPELPTSWSEQRRLLGFG